MKHKILLGLTLVMLTIVLISCSNTSNKNTDLSSSTGDVITIPLEEISSNMQKFDYTTSNGN